MKIKGQRVLHQFYALYKAQRGFTVLGVVVGVIAISLMGYLMQSSFFNYRLESEKRLHVFNAIKLASIVEIGAEEGSVQLPSDGNSTDITLSAMMTHYDSTLLTKNPSGEDQLYHSDSFIRIVNNAGKYEYYIELKDNQSAYVYIAISTQVHLLTTSVVNVE